MTDQFTRREVNRALLAAALTLAAPRAVAARQTRVRLFDFAIAGGSYHGLESVRDKIAIGERFNLRAEPENPHDTNAVAVHRSDGLMLGYIPREANEPIVRLLASGETVEAQAIGRLDFRRADDIPDDFAFTGFTSGDPQIRLTMGA